MPFDPVSFGRTIGLIQPLQMVGSRTGLTPGGALHAGTDTTVWAQIKHKLFGDPTEITLVYAGFEIQPQGTGETIATTGSYRVRNLTVVAGGSGHAVGDVITLPAGAQSRTATARVQSVNAGAVTKLTILDRGGYIAPFADGSAQAGTTGSGTGLTVNAEWDEFAYVMSVALYPDFGTLNATTGAKAPRLVSQGLEPGGGKRYSLSIPLGGLLVSDPIPMPSSPGDYIGLKYSSSGAVGSFRNHGRRSIANVEYVNGGTSNTNQVLSQSTLSTTASNPGPQPALILGRTSKRLNSFFLISHSFGAAANVGNSGDIGDPTTGNANWFERAIGDVFPTHTYARGGTTVADFFMGNDFQMGGRNGLMQVLALARPRYVILDRALNDITQIASPLATILANEQKLIAEIRRLIRPDGIWLVTTTPQTDSTDNWATLGNQTLRSYNSAIQTRNQQLRAGTWAAGHDFLLDWGGFVENTPGTATTTGDGLWVPGRTPDGTHLNAPILPDAAAWMRSKILSVVVPTS